MQYDLLQVQGYSNLHHLQHSGHHTLAPLLHLLVLGHCLQALNPEYIQIKTVNICLRYIYLFIFIFYFSSIVQQVKDLSNLLR